MIRRSTLALLALLAGCAQPENTPKVDRGKLLYGYSCGACHQPDGLGMDGVAPPLRQSPWTLGSEDRLVRIALHGVRGPIEVAGGEYNLEMPGMGFFDDHDMSAILSYTRRAWGNSASPITGATVRRIRKETAGRGDSWTVEELIKLP